MKKLSKVTILVRLVIIEIIILALAGLVSLVAGVGEYSTVLLVIGVIIFAIGPFTLIGTSGNQGKWGYQYGRTLEPSTLQQRAQEHKAAMSQSTELLWISVVLGGLTILISALIA